MEEHYRKHYSVVKLIKEGKEPSVKFYKELLGFEITEEDLILCSEVYDKRVSMPLPIPHTQHVAPFTALAGQESYSSKIILAGCYIIKGPNLATSPVTGLVSNECYIGQSTHLGHRVKNHAKGVDSTTCEFIKSLKDQGVVELCIFTNKTELSSNLTKNQFITLLEQFLIINLKPTVNKKFIATPGIMWTAEAIQKHRDKLSVPVYVYKKEGEKMTLIQIFPTTRSVGLDLGLGKSFYSNVVSRNNGLFKNKLYFTDIELENTEKDIMSLLELLELVEQLRTSRMGFGVIVTDGITGQTTEYDSLQAASRAIGIDCKGIRDKCLTGKLYKKRYKFELK